MKNSKPILTKFSLYNKNCKNIESTIFDLISGNKETKQTKGLAYILSKDVNLIKAITNIHQVKDQIDNALDKNIKLMKSISYIHIDAEMISDKSNKRRDITLSFYSEEVKSIEKKFLIIIIEAKSIKAESIKASNIDIQLEEYLDSNLFLSDGNIPKVAITLTSHKLLENSNSRIARVTWIEIIEILKKEIDSIKDDVNLKKLLNEYYIFITGVNKNMRFYEKEVLSVPAKNTFELIEKYFIHACPANKKSYNYKDIRTLCLLHLEKMKGL